MSFSYGNTSKNKQHKQKLKPTDDVGTLSSTNGAVFAPTSHHHDPQIPKENERSFSSLQQKDYYPQQKSMDSLNSSRTCATDVIENTARMMGTRSGSAQILSQPALDYILLVWCGRRYRIRSPSAGTETNLAAVTIRTLRRYMASFVDPRSANEWPIMLLPAASRHPEASVPCIALENDDDNLENPLRREGYLRMSTRNNDFPHYFVVLELINPNSIEKTSNLGQSFSGGSLWSRDRDGGLARLKAEKDQKMKEQCNMFWQELLNRLSILQATSPASSDSPKKQLPHATPSPGISSSSYVSSRLSLLERTNAALQWHLDTLRRRVVEERRVQKQRAAERRAATIESELRIAVDALEKRIKGLQLHLQRDTYAVTGEGDEAGTNDNMSLTSKLHHETKRQPPIPVLVQNFMQELCKTELVRAQQEIYHEELAQKKSELQALREKRRQLHRKVERTKGNVRVVIRMRPKVPHDERSISCGRSRHLPPELGSVTPDESESVVSVHNPTVGRKQYDFYRVYAETMDESSSSAES